MWGKLHKRGGSIKRSPEAACEIQGSLLGCTCMEMIANGIPKAFKVEIWCRGVDPYQGCRLATVGDRCTRGIDFDNTDLILWLLLANRMQKT